MGCRVYTYHLATFQFSVYKNIDFFLKFINVFVIWGLKTENDYMGRILKIAKVTSEKCMAFYLLIQHNTESVWLALYNVSVSRMFNACMAH